MRKKLLFLFIICLFSIPAVTFAQSGSVVITQNIPTSVTVCGGTAFSVNIKNTTGSVLSGMLLNIAMPGGVSYTPSSVTSIPAGVTESNITNLQNPVFTVPNLAPFAFITIAYSAIVDCNIITYQGGGNPIVNTATITYTNSSTDQNTSTTYNVNAPSLVITSFTNQTFTGVIGTTFTRSITLTNSGTGSLTSFLFTDVHGNQIDILSATPGILSGTTTNDTVSISGADFTTIGNNDTLFDTGESITIVETVQITKCSPNGIPSNIKAYWTCNGQGCQDAVTTANISVPPAGTPDLVITPSESSETCLDPTTARQNSLKIVNSGSGPANNIFLDIYQGNFTVPDPSYANRIDENSFTYQIGLNGIPTALPADSALNNNTFSCLGSNPKYYVYLHLPIYISPLTDTVYLKWNSYACCQVNSCGSSYLTAVAPWEYKGKYTDACDTVNIFDIYPTTSGSIYGKYFNTSMTPEDMPTDISDATTNTFEHSATNWQNEIDSGPGAYFEVSITIPPCFTLSAGPNPIRFRYNPNGTIWLPSSPPVITGNIATAIFTTPDPFGVNGMSSSSLLFDLTASCTSCPDSLKWGQSVGVDVKYNADPSCAKPCLLTVYCNNSTVNLHCGGVCTNGGMGFISYSMERTSFGLRDSNDDGLPEPGSVDLNLIKKRRAMTGDTLTGHFKGYVDTSLAHLFFTNAYASAIINNLGPYISFIDATVVIHDASTSTIYTCTNVPPLSAVVSGSNFESMFDLSPAYLSSNGCGIPPGFLFEHGDSVLVYHRYKVTGNTGGPVVSSNTTTDFYLSDIPNPPPNPVPANKFTCDNYSGNYLSLYGYYFASDTIGTYVTKSCNTPTIRNTNLFSIGPCCQNYGSNKFPFEYRKWANMDTIKVALPAGYDYVSSNVTGIGQSLTTINPLNPFSDTLLFDVGALYSSNTWQNFSFDGYHNTISVTIVPSCGVAGGSLNPIKYDEIHKKEPFIGGGYSTAGLSDLIIYTPPILKLTSPLQTVDGDDNIEQWDITFCNISNNSTAENAWLSFVSPNNTITVVDVMDTLTSTLIPPTGDIYQLGTKPFNTCATYRIRFTYNACTKDSLIVNAGWNCIGYPASLSTYPCTPKTFPLIVDPKPAALQMQVAGPARDTVDLCDTTTYEVILTSTQLSPVYNIVVTASLPPGMSVSPGTSEILYPETPVVWTPISDPVSNQWHLSDSIAQLLTGLPGVNHANDNQVRIRFKIRPDCNYTSGSTVPFSTTSTNVCGQSLPTQYATSSQLHIRGVEQLNITSMTVIIDTVLACGNTSTVKVKVVNVGPNATTGNEHFDFPVTGGAAYVPGTFTAIHNAPPIASPATVTISGATYTDWQFPVGVPVLDSVVFSFSIAVNPDSVDCSGNITFPVKTTGAFTATCISDNSVCTIIAITSAAEVTVPVSKPCLSISSFNASSLPANNGENINIDYTVFNACGDKASGLPVTVYFYFDNDNSGTYSTGDTLIGSNTITDSILSNTGNTYSNISFFSSAVSSCSVLAVIDTSANSCTCSNSVLASNLPLLNAGPDSAICSGDSILLGLPATSGYTYSWSPTTGLSAPSASSTNVFLFNLSTSPLVQQYIITTNRIACTSNDTMLLTVNPIPTITVTPATQTFCSGTSTSIVLTSNVSGANFTWTVVQNGVSGATADTGTAIIQTLTTTGSSTGTVVYTITPFANGCPGNNDSALITVNPVDASASFNYSSGTYCQSGGSQTPAITGLTGGVFTFSPAGLVIDSVTGTIDLTTSALGTYIITYTTSGICPNTSSINLTITNTTPSATFSYSSTSFCPNGVNPFPVFAPGASAGIFTATPSGLVFVNMNTGEIDLTASVPGTYTVVNTIPASGSCLAASATTTVTIALDDASFVYTSATYCISGANPTPVVTGLPGGTFSSTPAGLVIDSLTGTIDLSTSIVGAYTLSYTTNGNCPNTSSILMTIDSVSPSSTFNYSDTVFCLNGNNPLPIYPSGGSAGIYTASPSGLVFVHVNTGEIDLAGSTPGTYTITNTIPVSGTCLATSSATVITITPADDASFVYSSGTYCTSGTNPTPSITGIPGGTFSASPSGLSIDTSTGTIDLSLSIIGTYTVSYTTNDSCPNTSSVSITIGNTTPSASFIYSAASFCQNGNNPLPIFAPGASAGTFTSTPSGLVFVNTVTGEINLPASALGTYTVVNTIPASGSCLAATASTTVTITLDDASFTYTSATYCQSGTNPTPTITGLPGGTFSAVPAGLSINPSTGTIDLANSTQGSYTLSYTTNGTCSNTSSIVMTIANTTPSSTFAYASGTYCQNATNPSPVYPSGASAGFFTASPAGLVFVHVNTGEIDLSASTPGIYTVTNTIPASGTCLSTFATTTIVITPSDDASFHYSSGTYCQSGTDPNPVITGLPGGTFSSAPAGLTLNSTTGAITLSSSALGLYTVTYSTNGACPSTSSITVNITNTTPPATFSYPSVSYCSSGNNPLPVFAPGASAGIFSASPAGIVFVNLNTGEIDLTLSTPGTYTVTNTIPTSGTCMATFATSTITITEDDASFYYSSGTYCQSGTNPTPYITGISGGTFSSSPAGLMINASTGLIDLANSVLGVYTITYTTNGSCPNSSSIQMTISNVTPSASFSYIGSPFCQNSPNPTPVPGSNPGIFSATPSGLSFVNLNTGEINLSLSTPGTYVVTNTIPASGTCLEASATEVVIITPPDDASFTYTSATYCQSGANPTATVTGVQGGFFSATPVGLSINPTTGTIDLASSALNVYTLSYTTNGVCPNTSSIAMTITNVTPSANFSYSSTAYCQYDNNPYPIFNLGASAGLFVASPAGLNFVHVNTGQIDLSTSAPGTYTVFNTIPASGTCLSASATYTITIDPAPQVTTNPSSIDICTGSTTAIPLTSSMAGTSFIWSVLQVGVTGASANSGTTIAQTLTLTGSSLGTAVYTVTPFAGGCLGLPTTITVTVRPVPQLDTTGVIVISANCNDSTGSIQGISFSSGVPPFQYEWTDSNGIVVDTNANFINASPGTYTLTATDVNGCPAPSLIYTISSTSFIVASFTTDTLSGETPLTVNFTNTSTNATNYLWLFGTGDSSTVVDPSYIYLPTGTFTVCLMADNGGGCVDTACSTVDIFVNSTFEIPNIFSPNGDGINDIFFINSKGLRTVEAEIYNRWGQKLYEWNTPSGGWDGRSASGVICSDGTYYYIIRASGFDGKNYYQKGTFSLIK